MPKLSVLTACFNGRRFLAESLASSLASDEQDIEVIFVDDGSTDGSYHIAAEMQAHDPRVVIARHLDLRGRPVNKGHASAMNTAARVSSSPWLLKMDSDDKMHPSYISAILKAADFKPELNVIFSPARCFGLQTEDYRYPDFDPARMIEQFMIPGPSGFRRELWRSVGGFDESLPCSEDWDFWVRAQIAVGLKTLQFNEPLWFYRFHDGHRMSIEAQQKGLLPNVQAHMRNHTRASVERQAMEMRMLYGANYGEGPEPGGLFRGAAVTKRRKT